MHWQKSTVEPDRSVVLIMAFMRCGYKHKLFNLFVDGNVCKDDTDLRVDCVPGIVPALMYPSWLQWQECFMVIRPIVAFFLLVECLREANISKSPDLYSLKPFVIQDLCIVKHEPCPQHRGISDACAGCERGHRCERRLNSDERRGLLSSALPPQFTVSTPLHFLLPVSGERAVAETTGEPLHSKTDFYFQKKKKVFQKSSQTQNSTQIWVRPLTARCLLEIHTHTHTTTSWPAELK